MVYFQSLVRIFHRMSLLRKTLLVFGLVMLLLFIIMDRSSNYVIFDVLATREISRNLAAVEEILIMRGRYLHQLAAALKAEFSHHDWREFTWLDEWLDRYGEQPNLSITFDFVWYVDADGQLLYSSSGPVSPQEFSVPIPLAEKIFEGKDFIGYMVLSEDMLRKTNLLSRTAVEVRNRYRTETDRNRVAVKGALVQVAAVPVRQEGQLKSVIVVGDILNRDTGLLDWLSSKLDGHVSLFLGPVLVATSRKDMSGERVFDHVLSPQVYRKVLEGGEPYYGRELVMDEWVYSAYKPLVDFQGRVIGAIYVGTRELPFVRYKKLIGRRILVAIASGTTVFLILFGWVVYSVIRPIKHLATAYLRIAKGTLDIQVPAFKAVNCWEVKNCRRQNCPAYQKEIKCWFVAGGKECTYCQVYKMNRGNEINFLADGFNFMVFSLKDKRRALEHAYAELERQNRELAAKQQELLQSLQALEDSQNIVVSLALAVEAKDRYTKGHSDRVACYARKLAQKLKLSKEEQSTVALAGRLHDIGKIGIQDSILNKKGKLTEQEKKIIQEHPLIGERICSSLKFARGILPVIRHHHERYDGGGYPDGLAGEKIPLLARIVAIADAYDAMTSDRPYRPGLEVAAALSELKAGAGTQWDPELVDLFIELIREDNLKKGKGQVLICES
ncbi:HD domain-containing phosphohydrolase [Calderihabitans maritimus]|uniref:Metal dependent phosphohydrolase n=1 Tax=Calderihabitans maritimus TaxID=1246530 RepID=A0A1Z5HPX0_9FIRM|nr:HD domain-containing phosphohydrolase [Calderihabitans maritimus]GAW91488.1 metal dependent phosphohydrolase [Calderihabitans maritimus]